MKTEKIVMIIGFVILLLFVVRFIINKFFMFEKLVSVILRHEGGYVNDPDDLGGETNFGISKRYFPNVDIKNLTKDKAKEIYYNNFYVPMEIDKIQDVNLAMQYFDMGVNAGIKTAKRLMSEAKEIKKNSNQSLTQIYKELRKKYYKDIAELRNNKKFLKGWLNRVETSIIV